MTIPVQAVDTDQLAVPVAAHVPARATVLNPQGHWHPPRKRGREQLAVLECAFCALFLLLFAIFWWYLECEAHYFHHSCSLLYRSDGVGGEQQLRPLQSPSWYVQHLLDNQHVVRTGPTMAQRAAAARSAYDS